MRTCKTCGTEKPLMDFYNTSNGNLDRHCKPCRCAKVRANRLVRVEKYAEYERGRAMLPHRIACREAYQATPTGREALRRGGKAWDRRNPLKKAASQAVNNAVRDGRLFKQPCEVCGEAKAQAHHDDYSKPLDVRWLCTTHHREWHKHNMPKCPPQDKAA